MQRRTFLKTAAAATLTTSLSRYGTAVSALQEKPLRIAYGGIGNECSTYSRIRTRLEDFDVLTGDALTNSARFAFLKNYPVRFMPTVVAAATPGGPVDRATYDAIKTDFLKRLASLLPLMDSIFPCTGRCMWMGCRMQRATGWSRRAKFSGRDACSLRVTTCTEMQSTRHGQYRLILSLPHRSSY